MYLQIYGIYTVYIQYVCVCTNIYVYICMDVMS